MVLVDAGTKFSISALPPSAGNALFLQVQRIRRRKRSCFLFFIMLRETTIMNGTKTTLINDDLNCVWLSSKPIRCSFCRKYCGYMSNYKFTDGEVTVCHGQKCFENIMNKMKFMEEEYVFTRSIECPENTKETQKLERNGVSFKLRWTILKRDNFKCVACGSSDKLEIDHIIPIVKGGKSTEENLQSLCFKCNRGKYDE